MKRRQLLQHLSSVTGGIIAARLLSGCQTMTEEPLFALHPQQLNQPLPEHLVIPVGEFYVQSYAQPPQLTGEQWQLEITGAVQNPLRLTLSDILQAAQEEFYLTLECIGNVTGGDQIGNALWRGTSVLPFLQEARVQPEAVEWVLHGADSYETTLPIADVLRPDVRLVHQMNGQPLTPAHGYPVRILIPGRYGQKQPKWLVKMEAITRSKQGYWERQGWSNRAEIPTHAMTRQIQTQRVWNRQTTASLKPSGESGWRQGVLIAGIALDRALPIQTVMVSTDGGQTWHQARQNQPPTPHEWTLWQYRWQPQQPGHHTIMAYAITQREIQPIEDPDRRDGSSGVLKIQVMLER